MAEHSRDIDLDEDLFDFDEVARESSHHGDDDLGEVNAALHG